MLIADLRFSLIIYFVEHSLSEKFKSVNYNMKDKVTDYIFNTSISKLFVLKDNSLKLKYFSRFVLLQKRAFLQKRDSSSK